MKCVFFFNENFPKRYHIIVIMNGRKKNSVHVNVHFDTWKIRQLVVDFSLASFRLFVSSTQSLLSSVTRISKDVTMRFVWLQKPVNETTQDACVCVRRSLQGVNVRSILRYFAVV